MKLYFADFNFSKSKLHYKDDIRDKLINEYLLTIQKSLQNLVLAVNYMFLCYKSCLLIWHNSRAYLLVLKYYELNRLFKEKISFL